MLEREGLKLASFFLRGGGSVFLVVRVCARVHACVSGREKTENV